MTENLTAETRNVPTPELNSLRKEGKLPVELYGHQQQNQHLMLKRNEFAKIYKKAGESSLVDLVIGSQAPLKVIIQEVSYDPLNGEFIHADLLQVKMDEILQTEIPLVFSGESKAVKELGGTLIKSLEEVEISCLPADLIPNMEVDISVLATFDDAIRVADLPFPKTIKVLTDPETTVAVVQPQKVEAAAPVVVSVEAEVVGAKSVEEGAVAETKKENKE